MEEEFQESEIMFHEYFGEEDNPGNNVLGHLDSRELRNIKPIKRKKVSPSPLPVTIPDGKHWFDQYVESDCFKEEYGDKEEMVPPHVIIGQRLAGRMMAFSVCTGNGRTLKGRDLRQVRNSILRMTGFLET